MKKTFIILSVTVILAVITGIILSNFGIQTVFSGVIYKLAATQNITSTSTKEPIINFTLTPNIGNTETSDNSNILIITLTIYPTNTPTIVPTNTPTPLPTRTPTPMPTATQVYSPPTFCSTGRDIILEKQMINLINIERINKGLSELSANGLLEIAALGHSQDMACNNYFSHISPFTGSAQDRIKAVGFSYDILGETIAAGQTSASEVVSGWMTSLEHRYILLYPGLDQIGVGHAYLDDSNYMNYFTAYFGSP